MSFKWAVNLHLEFSKNKKIFWQELLSPIVQSKKIRCKLGIGWLKSIMEMDIAPKLVKNLFKLYLNK